VRSWEEFHFFPGVPEAVRRLKEAGFRVFVVSNQAGVGKGLMKREDLEDINRRMLSAFEKAGAKIDGAWYCVHDPKEGCRCRKPGTGLFEQAAEGRNLDRGECFTVGDSLRDIESGARFGGRTVLVLSGKHEAADAARFPVTPDYLAGDLVDAVSWILGVKKKVWILHASAGHGHLKAAEAVRHALLIRTPDWEVELFDALDFFPRWFKRSYVGSYISAITKSPRLWGVSYAVSDCRRTYFLTALVRRFINGFIGRRLSGKIRAERPDVVVATHFMPPEVCAALQKKRLTKARCLTVITDFLVHRFWIFKETRAYAVACERTLRKLESEGIDPRKVTVTGIPIDPKFGSRREPESLRRRLEIRPDRFTVLFTSGGMGAKSVEPLVEAVCRRCAQAQMVVICGNNKALQSGMRRLASRFPDVHVRGFVDNMDEWMDASDVIVGKAGGLTVSESLAKGKPLFILSPVPGQEVLNAEVLTGEGAAFWVRRDRDLPGMINAYREDPELKEKTQKAIQRMARPDSG